MLRQIVSVLNYGSTRNRGRTRIALNAASNRTAVVFPYRQFVSHSVSHHPTVGAQHLPIDPCSIWPSEERHHIRDLVGFA